MKLNWRTFKQLKENEEGVPSDQGFEEPEYEKDHGHAEADLNAEGGFEPENEEELERYKHTDLITLPPDVQGTNCGNCKYIKKVENGLNFCVHEDVEMYVTPRMCCKYWDNVKVKRSWGEMTHEH